MRTRLVQQLLVGLACAGLGPATLAAWTSVGPGIDYQQFHTSDPNNLFVARMSRDNTQCFVDTTLGGSRLGVSETIGSQASRYDDAVSYWHEDWGLRNDVIVAVNGDFLDTSNNTPLLGMMMSGWYMKDIEGGGTRFYYNMAQDLAVGYLAPNYLSVRFLDSGASRTIWGVNQVRGTDALIVYTHHYDSTTKTDNTGTEVLVEMTRPMLVLSGSDVTVGTVRQVRPNAGSTPIPFDHVVLSGAGASATWLTANAHVGDRIGIRIPASGSPADVSKTYATLGGGEVFLSGGFVLGGQNIRNPRTAIASNDEYLFFVVCDGRRAGVSVGMTMTELAYFCQDYLGATDGINQDGGGSSTMIVNGVLKNVPSDGSQRAVVNGIFMGITQPKLQSTTFNSGDIIKTGTSTVTVRLGPGSHFLSAGTVAKNTQGTIVDHHLRGIYAKGSNWWKCDFGSIAGWISQSSLTLVTAGNGPRFTQHPATLNICPGSNASFTVAATGTGALGYQWQFNGTDIADDAVYSGTNTATLSLATPAISQNGSYRCVVTDANSSTTSYSAPLHLMVPTTVVDQPLPLTSPLVARGANAVFTTHGKGDGAVSYQWQKNGVNIVDSTKYIGTVTASLTVVNVDTYDEGIYRCVITSTCGTAITADAGLTVRSTDFNRDGFVDLSDFGHLQACFLGAAVSQTDPACQDADINPDILNDVGADDLADFLQCLTGPGVPRLPGC